MSGCSLFCGNNRNQKGILWAAILGLILINCLDDDCIAEVAAFLVVLGDTMVLGTTSGCFNKCSRQEIKNSYY